MKNLKKIVEPFCNNYNEFINSYIIPEVVAFYIASSYYRNAMYETSFIREYNFAKDLINANETNKKRVIAEIKKLLKIKYSLEIINDNPLEIKEIKY